MSEESTVDIIERARDAVVGIEAIITSTNIFSESEPNKQGSGFVIDNDGYIITNYHVVMDAESIYVTHKKKQLQGTVINTCAPIDLALVKVDEDLPVAELGDSDDVKVGQRIYAIGLPLGIRGAPTVTSGIISGVKRLIETKIEQEIIFHLDTIQTDANVNPGSSGGPLINTQGKVIGVALAEAAGSHGIGFNIPVKTVKQYFDRVKAEGKYDISWIGIRDALTITPLLNRRLNLGTDYGALITDVDSGSPLEEAGLGPSKWSKLFKQDLESPRCFYSIVSFNNSKVESLEDLLAMVRRCIIGSVVKLGVICKGHASEVNIKVGQISATNNYKISTINKY